MEDTLNPPKKHRGTKPSQNNASGEARDSNGVLLSHLEKEESRQLNVAGVDLEAAHRIVKRTVNENKRIIAKQELDELEAKRKRFKVTSADFIEESDEEENDEPQQTSKKPLSKTQVQDSSSSESSSDSDSSSSEEDTNHLQKKRDQKFKEKKPASKAAVKTIAISSGSKNIGKKAQ